MSELKFPISINEDFVLSRQFLPAYDCLDADCGSADDKLFSIIKRCAVQNAKAYGIIKIFVGICPSPHTQPYTEDKGANFIAYLI